jgi:hypothetical protein
LKGAGGRGDRILKRLYELRHFGKISIYQLWQDVGDVSAFHLPAKNIYFSGLVHYPKRQRKCSVNQWELTGILKYVVEFPICFDFFKTGRTRVWSSSMQV